MEKLVVSRREAGELLGVSVRTIDYLLAEGRLPVIQIGKRRTLIPLEAIQKLVRRGSTEKWTNPPAQT